MLRPPTDPLYPAALEGRRRSEAVLQVRQEGPRYARHAGHIAIEGLIEPFRINTLEGFIALTGKYRGIVHEHFEGFAFKKLDRLCNCRIVTNIQCQSRKIGPLPGESSKLRALRGSRGGKNLPVRTREFLRKGQADPAAASSD